jgi:DNA-binding SARP family transcriptional activator
MSVMTATSRSPAPVRHAPASSISVSLLSGFELRVDGGPVEIPLASQRVVVFLALNRGRVARLFVAGHLWIDASEQRAAAALRTALWRIGRPAAATVRCDGSALSIDPAVDVDLHAATSTARELLAAGDAPVPASAFALLRDDAELLPDWYEDWVIIARERFRQQRLHALEALCGRFASEGRHAEATEAGLAAVATEPLRESAHRALISAHLAEGNACEALRQYRYCADLLRSELGLAPSPRLEQLVSHLRPCSDAAVTRTR